MPAAISTERARRGRAELRRRIAISLIVFVLLMAAWHLSVRYLAVNVLIAPAPGDVVLALVDGLFGRGTFWPHLRVTMIETLAGFGIGAVVGAILGVLIAESRILRDVLYPYIVAFQTVPKVAIAPLFVIWLGFGIGSKIAIAATIAFFPVVVNMIEGLAAAEASLLEMMSAFGASRRDRFLLVKLPASLPFLFAGLDIAIVLAVIGAIVAEFVGAQAGLGYLIMQYNFNLDTAGIFAVLIVLAVIGTLLHWAVTAIQARVIFWKQTSSSMVRA